MRDARYIAQLNVGQLRRLVTRQQVAIAEHEYGWALGSDPAEFAHYKEKITAAKRIKKEVYADTKGLI